MHLDLPAQAESVPDLRRQLSGWLEKVGMNQEDRYDLVLAAAELVANAVEHPCLPSQPNIAVTAHFDGSAVMIVVADHGQWKEGPGSLDRGRGLTIVDAVVDARNTTRHLAGTTVTISKRLTGDVARRR